MIASLPEYVDGLPNLSGSEDLVERAIAEAADSPVFLDDSRIRFDRIRSACAIALHMHQPLTPTGGDDLHTAALIGNLPETWWQARSSARVPIASPSGLTPISHRELRSSATSMRATM